MDVSTLQKEAGTDQVAGTELIQQLITLTGLPEEFHEELQEILMAQGTPIEELTMNDVRLALVDFLVSLEDEIPDHADPTSPIF